MQLKAIKKGWNGKKIIQEGEIFEAIDNFVPSWAVKMEPVKPAKEARRKNK